MSNPYYALKNAVNHRHGGVCTPYEVRRELAAYLDWQAPRERAWGRKFWAEIMTREEYHALANRRKKRTRRKVAGETVVTYEAQQGQVTAHSDEGLTAVHDEDLGYIDEVARRHQKEIDDNAYYGDY